MEADPPTRLNSTFTPPSYLVGLAEEGVGAAALVDDVSDQVLLAVVGGQDADAVGRVTQQAHVHVEGHRILGLCQILFEREKRWGFIFFKLA